MIAAIIHNLPCKKFIKKTKKLKINIFLLYPAVNSRTTSMFFLSHDVGCCRERFPDSLQGAQKWSRQSNNTKNEIQYLFVLPYRQFQDYTEIYIFSSQDVWCCRDGVWSDVRNRKNDRGNNTKAAEWTPAQGPICGKGLTNTQSSFPPANSLNHPSHLWTTNTRGDPKLSRPCLGHVSTAETRLDHVSTTCRPRLNHV